MVEISSSDYLSRLREIACLAMNNGVSLNEFSTLDYYLIMLSKFVAVKEKCIIKDTEYYDISQHSMVTAFVVDCSLMSQEYLDMCVEAAKFGSLSTSLISIQNVPVGYDLDVLKKGIQNLQVIRNAISHKKFSFFYDELEPSASYLSLDEPLIDGKKVNISFRFLEKYLISISNENASKFIFQDDEPVAEDKFDNTRTLESKVEKDNSSFYNDVKKVIFEEILKNDVTLSSEDKLENNELVKDLVQLIVLAKKLGVDVNGVFSSYDSIDKQNKLNKLDNKVGNVRLDELVYSLSRMLSDAIISELRCVTTYSYANLLFSTTPVITVDGNIPEYYGLISTKGMNIKIPTLPQDRNSKQYRKSAQYIKSVISIIRIRENMKKEGKNPNLFEYFIRFAVKSLAKKNSIVFNRLRNGIDHFKIKIVSSDEQETVILHDRINPNNVNSTHFICRSSVQDFHHIVDSYNGDRTDEFTLKLLFEELIDAIKMIPRDQIKSVDPTITDNDIDSVISYIENQRLQFETAGIDRSVSSYLHELGNSSKKK